MEGYYADWAVYLKENLELRYVEILEMMMDHFFDKRRYEVANEYANRLLEIETPQRPFTKVSIGKVHAGVSYDVEPDHAELGFEVSSHSDSMIGFLKGP